MSCSAKLPIYAMFTAAFFTDHKALVMIGLYVMGMVIGVLYGLILKAVAFKGEPVPFVMELPNYRLPSAGSVLRLMWEKAKDFLVRAFTVIFVASLLIWFYVFLVSRGIKEATGVNAVITISKFVPIFVAITAIIFLQKFDLGIFLANMSQGADPGLPFFDQVSNTMMITIWVFVGIEGAVAISGRAKKERDVGKATIIAFICVLSIYLMVSVLSMGVMPLSELAQLENPALAGVMEHAVGQWGAILINGGVVLSLVGAMLGYTVLSSESPYEAAEQACHQPRQDDRRRPHRHARGDERHHRGVPRGHAVLGQHVPVLLRAVGRHDPAAVPAVGGVLREAHVHRARRVQGQGGRQPGAVAHFRRVRRGVQLLPGVGVGATGLTLMSLLYAPGILMYIKGKKERNEPYLKSTVDKVVVAIILIAAVTSLVLLFTGQVVL